MRYSTLFLVGFLLCFSTLSFAQTNADPDVKTHHLRVAQPYAPLVPELTYHVPDTLEPHSDLLLTDIEDRPFFDRFSWQMFIGLIWPADPNKRGVANSRVTPENFHRYNSSDSQGSTPVVWLTFRTADDLFPGDASSKPPLWGADYQETKKTLSMFSKGHSLTEVDEAFSGPLIDQNHQYVRYDILVNEVMYNYIRHNEWYLKKNIPKMPTQARLPPLNGVPISQPQTHTLITETEPKGNSIEIKSAWRVMITEDDLDPSKPWRKADDLSRYYVIDAQIEDVASGEMKLAKMGLVGLHLVQKTPQFTEGIWASFEHIDNIEAPANSGLRPSFNSGGVVVPNGYSYEPSSTLIKEELNRVPVEVSRIWEIPNTPIAKPMPRSSTQFKYGFSTQAMNKTYQELLAGTVWQNYQLVITQWPTDPTSFYPRPNFLPRVNHLPDDAPPGLKNLYARAQQEQLNAYPRWAGLPLPMVGALNTTMETYFQNSEVPEQTSCMGCHYGAADTDFSWIVKKRTYPQPYNQGRLNPEDGK